MTDHPIHRLDETVHQRVRLGILALLDDTDRTHFTAIRDALGQTDGTLSRHLSALERAGYVELERGHAAGRPRTWVHLTADGRAALAAHLEAMREIIYRYPRDDAALVALFSAAAQIRDDHPPALGDVTLQDPDLPDGFERIQPSGPVNHRGEHPGGGASSRLADAGLRGGYVRTWKERSDDAIPVHVHVALYEWPDDATAREMSEAHTLPSDDATLEIEGVPTAARVSPYENSPAFVVADLAAGRLSCGVSVQGGTVNARERVIDLGTHLIRTQYERLQHAELDV